MSSRDRLPQILVVVLFVAACILGVNSQKQQEPDTIPRAAWNDATPLGGKGLRLLLQNMGYKVRLANTRLAGMPTDARVWFIFDPATRFTKNEAKQLLAWVKRGNTLVWAASPKTLGMMSFSTFGTNNSGISELRNSLGVSSPDNSPLMRPHGEILPPLTAYKFGAAHVLRTGVVKASGSGGTFEVSRPYVELVGNPFAPELAVLPYGTGRVIVAPDAMPFTNYALSKDDNVVLATNFVRAYVSPDDGAVYFDERRHSEDKAGAEVQPNLLYYLWQPPLRYALLQLLAAGLLLWAFYGRRLGAPVPLPDREPVTRASQFAVAMGSLFRKAGRPRAASTILGEEFRRTLTRRLGLSITDSDATIAQHTARITGLPERLIDRLLLRSRNPAESEADALADAQEMELVLRRLGRL
ncbi:MAG TPA: DUF4350 domain-containing protein [Abditibacteriaceae bacterium]